MASDAPGSQNGRGWHIDKNVPLALIITMLVQAGAIVIWGAQINQRMLYAEERNRAQDVVIERFGQTEADLRSLRVETSGRLNRIEDKLDRLIERGGE